MTTNRALRSLVVAACFASLAIASSSASAQEANAPKEAGVHFTRAVQLYSEADYRAALVEFKRAYEIAPNVTVLYNLGQTYYQLQNYAEALSSFERFLAEGGGQHRTEVENAVAVLKTRVGKLDITTPAAGWEIAIDDEVVGKSPLAKPAAVSIGRRKVSASKAGEVPVSRWVEVAAGETTAVALTGAGAGALAKPAEADTTMPPPATSEHGTSPLLIAGWVGTGALAAGAIVTGILASSKASDLKDARGTFPANKSDLDSMSSSVKTLALVTDILGASAIVLGGVSLYFTLTKPSSTTTARLGTSGSRLLLEGSF